MKNDINIGYDRFFHVAISGLEAEEMLQAEPNGTFLIRESTSLPGEYALSVKNEDNILHVRIYHDERLFRIVPKDNFNSLHALIDHYVNRPMIQYCGNAVRLKQPLMSTRFSATCVDDRIDCLIKVPRKANLRDGISEEFERLHHAKGPYLFMSCKEGRKAENVRKNRYRNVLPYDHTIIKLNIEPSSDPEVNDYINASLIEVKSDGVMYSEFEGLNKRYISTQGCMQNTVDSFWQMIYQENVRIIVMTTKELERGRLKCYKYWPDYKADALKTGIKNDISIRTIKEEHRGEYIVRKFELSNMSDASSTYEIYHYQFVSWEDQQSCPSNSLLAYLDDINECLQTKCSPNCGPMVVHCSAGIGRTGTLIVIDILLSRIKMFGVNVVIDVYKTVRMVREQRQNMVQTEAQYRFIYETISSYVKIYQERLMSSSSRNNSNECDGQLSTNGY